MYDKNLQMAINPKAKETSSANGRFQGLLKHTLCCPFPISLARA